jgi:ribonuclease R
MTRKEKILKFMEEEDYKPLMFDELITVLEVPKDDVGHFTFILEELEEEGRIIKTKKNRYLITEKMGLVLGTFLGNEKGFGFVEPDKKNMNDIFVPLDYTKGAMHKDRVVVKIIKKEMNSKKPEGEIVKIVERHNITIVGTFEKVKDFGFVIPDDKKIFYDFYVHKGYINNARNGQKVVCEVTKWPSARRNPEAKVVEILGNQNELQTDIKGIIKLHDLEEDFPESVYMQIKNVPSSVNEELIKKRVDLRGLNIVTIDGEDAKDLDDAVSIEKLNNGNYKLGVHIADVSHYVKEQSALDKEAFNRATSVYFPDKVIPMLPKELSNGICSLNPNIERLTLSVFMEIDNNGKVIDHVIFESVIKTKARMTYKEVTEILNGDIKLSEKYKELVPDFLLMKELSLLLSKKRFERGSIDFDFPETKILLDKDGMPIDVIKYELTISNKIIEEFMLVCNETVAEHMFWAAVPFVYRVHEEPNPEKIKKFILLLNNLGYTLKGSENIHPKELQKLLETIKGSKEERIISTVMLRSLMKARYSDENLGHFGLAANYYCHFTSPIRRYPDLVIHRIIKEHIKKGIEEKREEYLSKYVYNASVQSSQQEINAQEAERDVEDLLKVVYMKDKVGKEFKGIISGVTHFGFFVELDNTIEGLVRVESLEDDYYVFDEEHYRLTGENNNKVYKIGDKVKIVVVKANTSVRKIDFDLVSPN